MSMPGSSHEHHRFSSSERLKGYTEAVYCIVLTIMIIPLANSINLFDEETEFLEGLKEVYIKILIYMLAFLVIFDGWKDHVKVFESVEWVGDSVVIANLIMLLPVTCYPFAWAVLGDFIQEPRAIALLAGLIVFVSCIQLFIVCLTYRDKKYLDESLHHDDEYKLKRITLIFDLSLHILFSAVGGALSFASFHAGYAFLYLGLFSSWLGTVSASFYLKYSNRLGKYGSVWGLIKATMLTRRYDKGRFEVLADGVYAIVSTLIILDLSAEFGELVEEHHLNFDVAITEESGIFLAFVAIFITVGFLWYNHHAVFNYVHKVNNLMSFFNMLSLMFVGFMPFTFKLTSKYIALEVASSGHSEEETGESSSEGHESTTEHSNTTEAHHTEAAPYDSASAVAMSMQAGSFALFWASIFHLCMWFSAHWQRSRHMHSMKPYSTWKRGVVLAKLLVYPIFSLLVFLIAFQPDVISAVAVNWIGIGIALVFILIKIVSDIVYKSFFKGREMHMEDGEEYSAGYPKKSASNEIYPFPENHDPVATEMTPVQDNPGTKYQDSTIPDTDNGGNGGITPVEGNHSSRENTPTTENEDRDKNET